MKCNSCGTENANGAKFCVKCGSSLAAAQAAPAAAQAGQATPTTIVNNVVAPTKGNGIGVAGFVCALVAVFTCWIPILGWILWLVGAILSVVGIFREPRGLAIAGTVISFIDIILLLVVVGGIAAVGAGIGFLG